MGPSRRLKGHISGNSHIVTHLKLYVKNWHWFMNQKNPRAHIERKPQIYWQMLTIFERLPPFITNKIATITLYNDSQSVIESLKDKRIHTLRNVYLKS